MTESPEREIGSELVGALHNSSGSFELVAGAVVAALVGFGIDSLLGLTPIFTVIFAVAGLLGATYSILFAYRTRMEAAATDRTLRRDRGTT